MSRRELAVKQIALARKYVLRQLENTAEADWYRQPTEGITHIAWQVGHLAMAEYRLALERLRGREPADELLIPDEFLIRFGRESVPEPNPQKNPSPAELRAVLDRVHQQVLHELSSLAEAALDEPPRREHPLFTTKLGALSWCAQHEMTHAGQIGLLRRLLGYAPLW